MASGRPNGTIVSRLAILGAIVALVAVAGAIVTAATLAHGIDSHSTPILTTILGVIGTTVASLLALFAVVGVDRKVNGHLERLTTIAAEAAAASGDPYIVQQAAEASETVRQVTHGEVDVPPPAPPAG